MTIEQMPVEMTRVNTLNAMDLYFLTVCEVMIASYSQNSTQRMDQNVGKGNFVKREKKKY